MLLRMMSKWVWVSLALALVGSVFMAACGDDLSPTPTPQNYVPNPNYTPAVYPTTPPLPPAADSGGVYSNCGPYYGPHYTREDLLPNFLKWTPDGSHIVFDDGRGSSIIGGRHDPAFGSDVYLLDSGGTYLRRIVDANPGFVSAYGTYADVSPDGKRIVYASCEYGMDRGIDYTGPDWKEREQYEYEIVTRNIDGTDPRRLTENIVMDHFPVWSPDGSRIAFARSSNRNFLRQGIEDNNGIVISSPDGSDQRVITSIAAFDCNAWAFGWHSLCSDRRVQGDLRNALDALVGPNVISWSPDGGRLAFESGGAVHTVGADGSDLTRLSIDGWMVTEAPAWSPDGSLVAFARSSEDISDIVVSAPDGSDQRAIVGLKGISLWTFDGSDVRFSAIPESTDSGEQRVTVDLVATSLAWSPDGSEIRFVGVPGSMDSDDATPAYAGIFSVGIDGADMRIITEIEWPSLVSWSPDGSRIAVRIMLETFSSDPEFGVMLYTLSSDGSDKRILARRTQSGKLAAESEWQNEGMCSEGYVVPDPQDNPGLVRDCEALLRIRDALAGGAALNWSFDVSITGWQGIIFDPTFRHPAPSYQFPLRVRGLSLHGEALGNSRLTGTLPAELGSLDELEVLILVHHRLTGGIPPELGNLSNLRVLDLSDNGLTGGIPLELSGIGKDLRLYVRGNPDLTGSIPLGLWYFAEDLDIRGTSLMPPPGKVCTDADFARRQCRTE